MKNDLGDYPKPWPLHSLADKLTSSDLCLLFSSPGAAAAIATLPHPPPPIYHSSGQRKLGYNEVLERGVHWDCREEGWKWWLELSAHLPSALSSSLEAAELNRLWSLSQCTRHARTSLPHHTKALPFPGLLAASLPGFSFENIHLQVSVSSPFMMHPCNPHASSMDKSEPLLGPLGKQAVL